MNLKSSFGRQLQNKLIKKPTQQSYLLANRHKPKRDQSLPKGVPAYPKMKFIFFF
jgi:hypothetical protein